MTTLTLYTDNFDSEENVVNNGLSGKAFLDMDGSLGFSFKSLDEALDYSYENNIPIHRIEMNWLSKNEKVQMFKKFNVA